MTYNYHCRITTCHIIGQIHECLLFILTVTIRSVLYILTSNKAWIKKKESSDIYIDVTNLLPESLSNITADAVVNQIQGGAYMGIGILIILLACAVMAGLAVKANRGVAAHRLSGKGGDSLASFGYKQELLRDMGGFSNFAVSFSVISVLTGAVTLYGFGFNQGGPGVMGFGWPLVTLFVLFVAAGMAELCSAIPTSGAIYHWSSILGGKAWGWFSAWFNMVGQVTVVAGIDFGCAGFASSLLFSDPTKMQTLMVYAVILLSHGLLNHVGIRIVAKLNDVSAIYHLIGVGIIIAALVYFGPSHKVSYLFDTGFSGAVNSTTPYWFAFLVGLLQAQWTYTGYDASAHTSEETVDRQSPLPMGCLSVGCRIWCLWLSDDCDGDFVHHRSRCCRGCRRQRLYRSDTASNGGVVWKSNFVDGNNRHVVLRTVFGYVHLADDLCIFP